MIVRPSLETDAPALAAIYGHHVLTGLASFEEVPPTAEDMAGRRAAVVALGLPYLVAEEDGTVLGFAYAGAFRPRAAYRYTVEDSVYVSPDAIGKGVGRAVLSQVLAACEALGLRQVMAVIGDSGNAASIGLHQALGFEHAGVCKAVGFKHGRWVDTVWMQKSLNGGEARAPDAPGLALDGH
ncbi:GNAT family N-acetyltransferase [Phenylobacterium aquaticum]|uniref:GNAT family N-acetyltransferase n=1 Tax=Phenylobacterium aquaticum TaxID=1763816 RepID=UPI0026F347DD|nr:GNAT family N-acetyltransferase [Phenylobacterium aquaticum]